MRHITINSRQWAVGLQWFSVKAKDPTPTTSMLRREAEKFDNTFDMVAFRQRQYGFASSGGVVREWLRVRALAAAVRIPSPSFLGLFCLADGAGEFWWVFASAESNIVGMGDKVFELREDAEEWIQSLRGLRKGFGETVICETVDESVRWLTPLVSVSPLSWLRSHNGSLQPLRPVPGQRRKLAMAGGLLVLFLGGGIATKMFLAHQAGRRAVEAARIAMVNKEQRRRELLLHPENHFARPWLTAPAVQEFVACGIKSLLAVPIVSAGWALERVVFDGQALVVTWGYRSGADYVHLPPLARLESPQKAVSRSGLSVPRWQDPPTVLLSREESTRLLYQGTQILGAKLKLVYASPEKKRVEDIEITSPWMRGQWELADLPPAMLQDAALPDLFTKIPGLIIEAIALDKNIWIIKGSVYVAAQ